MFDISVLKTMKLTELQEIAKTAKTIKFNGVKKDDLIKSIIETQAKAAQVISEPNVAIANDEKPKRARIKTDAKGENETAQPDLFETQTEIYAQPEVAVAADQKPVSESKFKKAPKFIKANKTQESAVADENVSETNTNSEPEAPENQETEEQKPQNPNQQRKKVPNVNANLKNPNQQKSNPNQNQNPAPNGNQNPNFKPKKVPNFRDSDYEFDGIIESEGV